MVDPVGTALGLVGLAAIFSTCLEVWDFIDATMYTLVFLVA
jgi:hypothetical protein